MTSKENSTFRIPLHPNQSLETGSLFDYMKSASSHETKKKKRTAHEAYELMSVLQLNPCRISKTQPLQNSQKYPHKITNGV